MLVPSGVQAVKLIGYESTGNGNLYRYFQNSKKPDSNVKLGYKITEILDKDSNTPTIVVGSGADAQKLNFDLNDKLGVYNNLRVIYLDSYPNGDIYGNPLSALLLIVRIFQYTI